MNYSDIEILVQNDESKTVEFKKTTGELKDAMRSACAFATSYDKHILFLLKYGYIERRGSKKNGGFYVKCSEN